MGSIQVIDAGSSNISSGVLGTSASNDLLSHLSHTFNNTYETVNDLFKKEKKIFINKFIQPIKNAITTIKNVTRNYKFNNVIRVIDNEKDLKFIPPVMYEPILLYRPIYDLLESERIFGFGIDSDELRDDDPYERMIENGLCENVDELLKKGKPIECVSVWKHDDPDVTFEELDYIEETRKFIDKILLETKFDPTDYPNNIG